eukprot:GEMP01044147.1.p1 GENE.GEMP01044147.1~~GEMP01044147.1.p1  ORF type:complete len:385 (+),score=63.74 GEMP01044147.1:138-1157(+)
MVGNLEVQIEVARLSADEPYMQDKLFVKLVRYLSFLHMLAKTRNSSPDVSRLYNEKLELAKSYISEAERVKASIIERLTEERRLKAEAAALQPTVIGLPPPTAEPSAPPLAAPDALLAGPEISPHTPSFPSVQPLVYPWEYPEEPPPPTIESFSPTPQLETRKEDRIYTMPTDLEKKFLQAAWSNTAKEVETCGILVGDLKDNHIRIDAILLPPQTGSYNTCEALDEMKVSEWQIEHGRISVGWIHTHPTQEAFLSSIDLHMHFSYQSLQPEALALVCAPTDRRLPFGKFHITDYGMEYLKKCTRTTGFHPHDDAIASLFEEVHVNLDDKMKVQVVDFR